MKLVKYVQQTATPEVGVLHQGQIRPLAVSPGHRQFCSLSDVLEDEDPLAAARLLVDDRRDPLPLSEVRLCPPIDAQEVWAAGVTYRRSRTARMAESEGAARFYDLVYEAPRPELFFKANPHRVVGPEQEVRIRGDARWSVPEPELGLVLSSRLRLVGYTIGNDMSARDIEGENPLYLPQAKVYDACCALGPAVTLADTWLESGSAAIRLVIRREKKVMFKGDTNVSQIARTFDELISWLGRDNSFPNGVVLLTGTGIVPPDDFTLAAGDTIEISIDGLGTLTNTVSQLK
ncbi:MAG: fumarylacetoacetate hydrolase family protein [Pirellulales bacterium]|nr:fumarylacetoacetate hydrolase family protein [Pirellulales bacterium]